jgi:hypothetical protein
MEGCKAVAVAVAVYDCGEQLRARMRTPAPVSPSHGEPRYSAIWTYLDSLPSHGWDAQCCTASCL